MNIPPELIQTTPFALIKIGVAGLAVVITYQPSAKLILVVFKGLFAILLIDHTSPNMLVIDAEYSGVLETPIYLDPSYKTATLSISVG